MDSVKVTKDDELAYISPDYLIYKRGAAGMGTLEVPMELLQIALAGIPEQLSMLKHKSDKLTILDDVIHQVKQLKLEIEAED